MNPAINLALTSFPSEIPSMVWSMIGSIVGSIIAILPTDLTSTLIWSERLLSIAILQQTIELLMIRSTWNDHGIWRWSTLNQEFQAPIFSVFFSTKGFTLLLILRLLCATLIWFAPCTILNAFLFLSTWLIAIRWRGLFNGGSDSMTIVVTIGLFLARATIDHPAIAKYALAYIALQLTLSYLVAGWVKLKNPEWRRGIAMPVFLKTPRYDSPPDVIRKLFQNPLRAKLISWTIIVLECAFPLSWCSPHLCVFFLSLALIFHLLNFWVFGLNRFVFAWLSAYPALYFWSQRHPLQ
jgi:hypothetical protein